MILASIAAMLADKGLDLLSSAIDGGADKAKEYIEEKTGIKLDSADDLTPEQLTELKKFEAQHELELKKLALENKVEDNRHAEKYEELKVDDKQNARGATHLGEMQTDAASTIFKQTSWVIPIALVLNATVVVVAKTYDLDPTIVVAVGNLLGITLNNAYRERQSILEFLFGSSVSESKDK